MYTCTRYRGTFADFTQDRLTVVSVCPVLFSPVGTAYTGAAAVAAVVAVIAAEYAVSDVSPSALIPRTRKLYVVLGARSGITTAESVNR
ncbi:hypothetical protein BJQ90_02712 [Arthrobacter sp. SO3]|nr:hypothetical protein [Arthrobacter sp. SO3]